MEERSAEDSELLKPRKILNSSERINNDYIEIELADNEIMKIIQKNLKKKK